MSYIGGKWRDDAPAGRLTSVNQATGEPVGEALLGDANQFVDAASVARDAQRGWAATPAPVRGRVSATAKHPTGPQPPRKILRPSAVPQAEVPVRRR